MPIRENTDLKNMELTMKENRGHKSPFSVGFHKGAGTMTNRIESLKYTLSAMKHKVL